MIYEKCEYLEQDNSKNVLKSKWIKNKGYDTCVITFQVEGTYNNIDILILNECNIILRHFNVEYKKEKEMIFSVNALTSQELQMIVLIDHHNDISISEPIFNFFSDTTIANINNNSPKILRNGNIEDNWSNNTYQKYKLKRLWVEITSRCNLKCLSCEKHYNLGGPYVDMEVEVFEKIINLTGDYIEELSITGIGEPLFHKKSKIIFDILDKFPHLKLDFVSNGELWNEYWLNRVSKFNSTVAISIDGPTEESHAYNRGKKSKLSHIRWLLNEAKNRNLDETFKLKFTINTLIMRSNLHLLPEMINFAYEHGVKSIVFIMMGNWGQPKEWYEKESPYLLAEEYIEVYEEIIKRANKFGINAIVPPPLKKNIETIKNSQKYQFCNIPFNSLYIHCNGKISPCCAMRPYIVGNIKDIVKKDDMNELFNSFKQNLLRNEIENKTYNELCLYCDLNYGINKGSPTRSNNNEIITNLLVKNLRNVQNINELFIYGGGEICLELVSKIKEYKISGIIDKKAKIKSYSIENIDVKSLDETSLKSNSTLIVASNVFANEIKKELKLFTSQNNIKLNLVLFNEYLEI